ncbi:MAG: hypothetical protein KKB50_22065 [Planctomycetes bacterium]|nr:hypothetical protein [Planctomycetota bacterium]
MNKHVRLLFLSSAVLLMLAHPSDRRPALAAEPHCLGTTFQYVVLIGDPTNEQVVVHAVFDGLPAAPEKLRVRMARRFAYTRLEEPLLAGPLQATADGQPASVTRIDPYTWDIERQQARQVRLEYVIPLRHRTLPDVMGGHSHYEFPYLAPDHGLLVAATMFVVPDDVPPAEISVRFELPRGWEITAPWPQVGPRTFDPGDVRKLRDDLFAVGHWQRHVISAGCFEGVVAFAPGQAELAAAGLAPIKDIVEHELALFGQPPQGRYLFLFGRPDGPGLGGSPKSNSMTLSVSPQLARGGVNHLAHLIAHEFFHTWGSAHFDAPDELRWFNEGFTDYYAYLVSARVGLLTWEAFAEKLGECMQGCAANPSAGKLSLAEAGGEIFFKDRHAHDLVYQGGLVVAAWLDRSIRARAQGQTLDDFMRALVNDPRWEPGQTAPTIADLLATLSAFVDRDTVAEAGRLVQAPFALDPVAAFGQLGLRIQCCEKPADLSLRANLDGTRVIDLDPAGLAGRLGIVSGDRFVEINGRAVTTADDVRTAWRAPADGHVRMLLTRGEKRIAIDEALPNVTSFVVPPEPWRQHLTTHPADRR